MICLGIESTAHTFGVSVIDEKSVLANVRKSFTTTEGGMLPSDVADHHVKNAPDAIAQALDEANKTSEDIDLIAFSQGPGIGHMLRIGAMAARTLALRWHVPLVGVNHCIAHLQVASMLFDVTDPVLLYVSGANTQVIAFEGGRYRIFGETLDIGAGNFLDSVARAMGLGFPGGPKVYAYAKEGKEYIPLPYTVKGMDVSFGGLLTNIRQKVQKGDMAFTDLAYSIQETIFAMLMEVSERALAHCEKSELLLGGGVACNRRLQQMATIMCEERGARCLIPPDDLLVDNAAMIAWSGILRYRSEGALAIEESGIRPYERTDDIIISGS